MSGDNRRRWVVGKKEGYRSRIYSNGLPPTPQKEERLISSNNSSEIFKGLWREKTVIVTPA